MTYTVLKLITNAYYLSGVVARNFQRVDGPQYQDGLDFLNEILGDVTIKSGMVPYYKEFNFNGVIGQEKYFIPYLIDLSTLVFFIDSVRYQMSQVSRIDYFGSGRADNINSLPFIWHRERTFENDPDTGIPVEGSNIYMYFTPDKNYVMQGWGIFGLLDSSLNQDLDLIYARFYINYLKYSLAVRICNENSYEIPLGVQRELDRYEFYINKQSQQLDLRGQKISTLTTSGAINYAIVNFGGWTV